MNTKTWKEIKDEIFGKVGTSWRDELERDSEIFQSKLRERERRLARKPSVARFYYLGSKWHYSMTELTIDKKKYILIPEKKFQELQKNAAKKWKPEKAFAISEAREYSKARIREWAAEK
ncbi:hypothetical protein [Dyadobacter sp. CY323]|uniref:hypothetical protein n=1 Tax=Dyadobacter sp. CY323 TaxID=2907302 RepID=UPI001F2583F9|nr:hypothetical protein [Dyadobacter sp. CY323]MCE6993147.1 hypothetical protein [Dyadobacter sp. CY323]